MGSNRQLKRNQEKAQYKKFARAWGNEKAYQKYVTETLGNELPAGTPRLGQKPTFGQWKEMLAKQAKHLAKERAEQTTKTTDDIPSLEWDEDEEAKTAGETSDIVEQAEVQGQ